MGGECLTTGCVPSKALIAAAQRARDMREAAEVGVAPAEPPPDLARALAHVRAAQVAIAPRDSQARYEGWGVEVVRGSARFTGARSLEVDGRRLAAPRIVLATGSRPRAPAAARAVGHAAPHHRDGLVARDAPGPAAGARRRLGRAAAGAGLRAPGFARDGGRARPRPRARRPGRHHGGAGPPRGRGGGREGGDRGAACPRRRPRRGAAAAGGWRGSWVADRLLVATGREAVTQGLDLDVAGVKVGDDGIEVDAARRTSNRRIYAIGDCRAGPRFSQRGGLRGRQDRGRHRPRPLPRGWTSPPCRASPTPTRNWRRWGLNRGAGPRALRQGLDQLRALRAERPGGGRKRHRGVRQAGPSRRQAARRDGRRPGARGDPASAARPLHRGQGVRLGAGERHRAVPDALRGLQGSRLRRPPAPTVRGCGRGAGPP